ncbi:AraC family transcriptional regulator [Hungatella sp.]|uniref:AraC family transcriptional regulator n=1 Tax=Hungatella sp. TaxID=2613924 RepID=UPI002A838FEF|nr:AraC family transcriptional regulator [Hungatella sp.]
MNFIISKNRGKCHTFFRSFAGNAECIHTKGPVKEEPAAEKTGYQDAFYFSKCFKRYFGISPSQADQ